MLYHISYLSSSQNPIDSKLISDILKASRENNDQDGITGVLMHKNDLFFQVLEGEKTVVERCYERTLNDVRHTGISIVWQNTLECRVFSDWAMGYAGPLQIAEYSSQSYQNLITLLSGKDTTVISDIIELELARQMFRDFDAPAYGK